jgi:hypothetical protein
VNVIVPFFLLAPLVLVPLGFRLLDVASPGFGPPSRAVRLVLPAGILLAVGFGLPAGPLAALLASPWLILAVWAALAAGLRVLQDPAPLHPDPRLVTGAAVAFLAAGATFAFVGRLGVAFFGFPPEMTLLAAVHFHFAGFVLPLAGALAYRRRPARPLAIALAAVIVGIPLTALGFFDLPLANWAGAMLTAAGGFVIGVSTVVLAGGLQTRAARTLARIAGLCLMVSMPMAAIHATGVFVGTAWLDVATMARIHGGLNSLGFGLAALLAWTLERRSGTHRAAASTVHRPRPAAETAAVEVAG